MPAHRQMEAATRILPVFERVIADRALSRGRVVPDGAFPDVHGADIDAAGPEEIDADVVFGEIKPIHDARRRKIADGIRRLSRENVLAHALSIFDPERVAAGRRT